MSTPLPLRLARIPAQPLRRQCLFQRPRPAAAPRPFAASTARPFSATPTRPYQRPRGTRLQDPAISRATAQQQSGPAPSVNMAKAMRDTDMMAEDIGLLQNTIVRAPLNRLPPISSWQFWSYCWALLKSKGAAFYTRMLYRQCLQKTGASRFLPVDVGKNKQLVRRAKLLYAQIHRDFAQSRTADLRKHCLPPLTNHFVDCLAARKSVKVSWSLNKWNSASVVSHRASPMGEDHPDTCYRQVIVRLESVQHTKIAPKSLDSVANKGHKPAWVPESARQSSVSKESSKNEGHLDEVKTVVDYFVMQRRVVAGEQEDWKAWGFTTPSTPATIEADEEYWRKAMEMQTASTA